MWVPLLCRTILFYITGAQSTARAGRHVTPQHSEIAEVRQTAQRLLTARALSSEEQIRRARILARAQAGESLGLEFCIDKMKSLGWEVLDIDLSYSGHQGIDLVFRKPKAGGGFEYAVCEAKSGKRGLGLLKKDADNILRQGSYEYNLSRLKKLQDSPNFGRLAAEHQQIIITLRSLAETEKLHSFAGMARAGKNGGGLFYELKQGWPGNKSFEKIL
jgi:hypothetical protein